MPALPVQCPRCTGLFELDSAWFGQPITCPLCQDLVVILHEMSSGDAAAADSSDLLPPVRSSPLAEQSISPDSADMLPPPVPTSVECESRRWRICCRLVHWGRRL